jgi:hypothetical protein
MLNSLIFKHYDFAAMEKVRENALISLFRASFYCGKEAKTLAKTSFRVVFSGRECYFYILRYSVREHFKKIIVHRVECRFYFANLRRTAATQAPMH